MVEMEDLNEENERLRKYLGEDWELEKMSELDFKYALEDKYGVPKTSKSIAFFKQLTSEWRLIFKGNTVAERKKYVAQHNNDVIDLDYKVKDSSDSNDRFNDF